MPLHKTLNRILRSIPQDMTFDQDAFSKLVIDTKGNRFHSIDLSAATDRFPIDFQVKVIGYLIGSERARAWKRVLTDYPFICKTPSGVLEFKYNTGQPMGAYSSWPAMALSHHFLVRLSAKRAGITGPFSDYFLLGDDLVIFNDLVAEQYIKLLSKFDMPFSFEKTHVSLDTFEFAKRWFHKGIEVTGFPISGLLSTYKKYPLLHNFLMNCSSHGWSLPIERHPEFIRKVFKVMNFKHYCINKVESMIRLYLIFDSLITIKHGNKSDEVLLEFFNRISKIAPTDHWIGSFMNLKEAFNNLLFNAKYQLVESDLYKFQTDAYKVNSILNAMVEEKIKSLSLHSETEASFIRETLSVVQGYNNPIVYCLNQLIDKSIE